MSPPVRVRGGWSVRIRYGADLRGRFRMPDMSEPEARDRSVRLERMARALADAGLHVAAPVLLEDAASQRSAKRFAETEAKAAEEIASAGATPRERNAKTFRDVCELWWSGELHRMAPDRVAAGTDRAMRQTRARLEVLCETVGDVPIDRFTLDTAERALAALPKRLMRSTRRAYAHRLARVLKLASLPPLRLIDASPIPTGWAPKKGPRRAFPFLYPDEDKQLLRSSDVDEERRWLYAFLAREGCRVSEALALKWSEVDTMRGVIRLDRNKTSSPRTWRVGQDVARALHSKRQRDTAAHGDRVFHCDIDADHGAGKFRSDLQLAGIKRSELFERTDERSPIRVHDLRGSFVTLALAAGKTETWVMDRTGHTTSNELNGYRRQARFAAEIGLGWYAPMDQLLLGSGQGRATRSRRAAINATVGSCIVSHDAATDAPHEAIGRVTQSQARPVTGSGPTENAGLGHAGTVDAVEHELAAALRAATEAGEWGTVAALATELGERRRARGGHQ